MADRKADLAFPMDQSCCGLPVMMMGEKEAAREVAEQNIAALDAESCDYVVTLCASCAAHLKNGYPRLLADSPTFARRARHLAGKVLTFSQLMNNVLGFTPPEDKPAGTKATFHAPCHLCRGMGEREAPQALIRKAGYDLIRAKEEETCCGFGGTYSSKFPAISSQILARKLDDALSTGAEVLITECPGCVLQLRGGVLKRGDRIRVLHLSEALTERED
jgi:Fe-S oxidoreductase